MRNAFSNRNRAAVGARPQFPRFPFLERSREKKTLVAKKNHILRIFTNRFRAIDIRDPRRGARGVDPRAPKPNQHAVKETSSGPSFRASPSHRLVRLCYNIMFIASRTCANGTTNRRPCDLWPFMRINHFPFGDGAIYPRTRVVASR